jgi:hypothetical protein
MDKQVKVSIFVIFAKEVKGMTVEITSSNRAVFRNSEPVYFHGSLVNSLKNVSIVKHFTRRNSTSNYEQLLPPKLLSVIKSYSHCEKLSVGMIVHSHFLSVDVLHSQTLQKYSDFEVIVMLKGNEIESLF